MSSENDRGQQGQRLVEEEALRALEADGDALFFGDLFNLFEQTAEILDSFDRVPASEDDQADSLSVDDTSSVRLVNGWIEWRGQEPARAVVFSEVMDRFECLYEFGHVESSPEHFVRTLRSSMVAAADELGSSMSLRCAHDADLVLEDEPGHLYRSIGSATVQAMEVAVPSMDPEGLIRLNVISCFDDENRKIGHLVVEGNRNFEASAMEICHNFERIRASIERLRIQEEEPERGKECLSSRMQIAAAAFDPNKYHEISGVDWEKARSVEEWRRANSEVDDNEDRYDECLVRLRSRFEQEGSVRVEGIDEPLQLEGSEVSFPDGRKGSLMPKPRFDFELVVEKLFGEGFFRQPLSLVVEQSEEMCRDLLGVFIQEQGAPYPFSSIESHAVFVSTQSLQLIARVMSLMHRVHSAGLVMPFHALVIYPTGMMSIYQTFDVDLDMFVDPLTQKHSIKGSRLSDFERLYLAVSKMVAGPHVEGWTKFVEEMNEFIGSQKWESAIDVEGWMGKLSANVHWRSVGQMLGSSRSMSEICALVNQENVVEWTGKSFTRFAGAGLDSEWTEKGGEHVLERLLQTTDRECRLNLLKVFFTAVFALAAQDSEENSMKWGYAKMLELGPICKTGKEEIFSSELLGLLGLYGLSRAALLNMCPHEMLEKMGSEVMDLRTFMEFSAEQLASMWDRVEVHSFGPDREVTIVVTLMYLVSAYTRKSALPASEFKTVLKDQLKNVDWICQQKVSMDRQLVHLVWLCGESVEQQCDGLNGHYSLSVSNGGTSDHAHLWKILGGPEMVHLVMSADDENYCQDYVMRYVGLLARDLWEKHKDEVDLNRFATTRLHGFSDMCSSEPASRLFSDPRMDPEHLFTTVWACGEPMPAFCNVATESSVEDFVDNNGVVQLPNDAVLVKVIGAASSVAPACQKQIVNLVVERFKQTQRDRRLTMKQLGVLAHQVEGLEGLCASNSEDFLSLGPLKLVTLLCPKIVFTREKLIHLSDGVNRNRVSNRLDVGRTTAFFDALPVLTCKQLGPSVPSTVYFNGEGGVDVGGLTREWFSQASGLIGNPDSCDPAGGLFKLSSNGYMVLNTVEGPLSRERRRHYVGFGRLMALAIYRREQLALELPTMFFAKLLNGRIVIEDLWPEEQDAYRNYINMIEGPAFDEFPMDIPELGREVVLSSESVRAIADEVAESFMGPETNEYMDAIREGFESLYLVANVRKDFSPGNLKLLLMGDNTLDVDALEKMVEKGVRSTAVSEEAFRLLFDWLKEQTKEVQKKFMQFVTGSPSLSVRKIKVTGPESTGWLPNAHTCFNHIAIPNYQSKDQITTYFTQAFANIIFGKN